MAVLQSLILIYDAKSMHLCLLWTPLMASIDNITAQFQVDIKDDRVTDVIYRVFAEMTVCACDGCDGDDGDGWTGGVGGTLMSTILVFVSSDTLSPTIVPSPPRNTIDLNRAIERGSLVRGARGKSLITFVSLGSTCCACVFWIPSSRSVLLSYTKLSLFN